MMIERSYAPSFRSPLAAKDAGSRSTRPRRPGSTCRRCAAIRGSSSRRRGGHGDEDMAAAVEAGRPG